MMKLPGFIRKTIDFITRGGSERLVLLLSVLIAFLIWFVHNFSLEYTQYFNYILNVKSNIEGRSGEAQAKEMFIIRGRSTGFYLLKHRSESQLTITLDPRLFKPYNVEKDLYYVTGTDLREKVEEALSSNVDIEYILTDTLVFEFPEILYKVVPVAARSNISCRSQYMPVGKISIEPKEVIVYGEEDALSRIDTLFTELISLKYLNRSVQGIVPLTKVKDVRVSEEHIYYSLEVDRYIEGYVDVPITSYNVPFGKTLMTLPSSIRVYYRRSFSDNSALSNYSFEYTVDYNDFLNTIDSKIIPYPTKMPDDLYSISIDPQFVECFLIDMNI